MALALVIDDTPDGDGPLDNAVGHLLVKVEADINGHDLRALKARHQSGRLINQLRGGATRLPMSTRQALITKLGISKSEIAHRMKLAETYQVDDLSNALDKFVTWHDLCRDGLYNKRSKPEATPSNTVPLATTARTWTRRLKATTTLSAADRKALEQLAAVITELLKGLQP